MQVDLKGQVALVTGGAQGIGRATTQSLLANGAAVAIVDLDGAMAEQTANELGAAGRSVMALAGDVSDPARLAAIEEQVRNRLGPISILINNAGINTLKDRRPIHEYSRSDWDNILRVDLTGVFVVSQAIVPEMI
ncbi:MAG TPA: SDR family NAD(P)-dependent oxidoreductase, partial [Pirellulales bacterium]